MSNKRLQIDLLSFIHKLTNYLECFSSFEIKSESSVHVAGIVFDQIDVILSTIALLNLNLCGFPF